VVQAEACRPDRPRDGRIVEDWSAFDGLELLRALGLGRTLLLAPGFLRPLFNRRLSRRAQ
jgi:hypothetical protein